MRSRRTTGAAVACTVCVAAVAVLTHDLALTSAVAGFAATALGLMTARHTSEDLARSRPDDGGPRNGPH